MTLDDIGGTTDDDDWDKNDNYLDDDDHDKDDNGDYLYHSDDDKNGREWRENVFYESLPIEFVAQQRNVP